MMGVRRGVVDLLSWLCIGGGWTRVSVAGLFFLLLLLALLLSTHHSG